MAILGKENVLEMVRQMKSPYWKISENKAAKEQGNYVAKADFENANLGLEESLDVLRTAMNRLTPGQYFFTAAKSTGVSKGIIDCLIEITRDGNSVAGIGSVGYVKPLYLDGIGEVTADNFEQAIEAKFKKMQDEVDKKKREQDLLDENKRLKAELADKESGINGGLYSIGAMIWPQLKKSAVAKDLMKTIAGVGLATAKDAGSNNSPTTEQQEAAASSPPAGGAGGGDPQERITAALGSLLGDDPENPQSQAELAEQLELLAKTKRQDPDTYNMGLDYLKGMTDE